MFFQKLSAKIRKNRIGYYARTFLKQLPPAMFYESLLPKKLSAVNSFDQAYLAERVNYYNKLNQITGLGADAFALRDMQMSQSPKTYNFDTFEYSRFFDRNLKISLLRGDVTHVPDTPSIQKSRPVTGNNANAVLLNLDKKRHFVFINDDIKFGDKKNLLIGRGSITQPHRIKFMEQYFDNPLCDLGQVNKEGGNQKWIKPKISIPEHLAYKFILSLEGNDVATNLKWIMSSNSIAVMPRPKYETWFMEGRLIPDHHYMLINDDYSDLEEKLQYYIDHPEAAQAIINNANAFVKQFLNKKQEDLIALLVLEKYFYYTSQIAARSI
jgi:hypothetical protein